MRNQISSTAPAGGSLVGMRAVPPPHSQAGSPRHRVECCCAAQSRSSRRWSRPTRRSTACCGAPALRRPRARGGRLRGRGVQSAPAARGAPYRLVRSIDGLLREFEYQIDADRFLRIVSRDRARPEVLDAEVVPYEKETSVAGHSRRHRRGASVAHRGDGRAGETIQLAMALADIFSGQIDFNSDLQPGDTLRGAVREVDPRGAVRGLRRGPRRAVRGRRQGHQAFRWIDPDDRQGRLLRRAGPVAEAVLPARRRCKFEPRITSGFSRRRLHPVAQHYRAHLGVDYGAPTGAAVVAVAAGTVVSAGWAGGGGKQVRIRARRRLRDLLPAPVVVRRRASAPARASTGTGDRPRRRHRHRDRAASRLPAASATACS